MCELDWQLNVGKGGRDSFLREISGILRRGTRAKIGITANPQKRRSHYSADYRTMTILHITQSERQIRMWERELITYFQDSVDNIHPGGNGNLAAPPYYLYIVHGGTGSASKTSPRRQPSQPASPVPCAPCSPELVMLLAAQAREERRRREEAQAAEAQLIVSGVVDLLRQWSASQRPPAAQPAPKAHAYASPPDTSRFGSTRTEARPKPQAPNHAAPSDRSCPSKKLWAFQLLSSGNVQTMKVNESSLPDAITSFSRWRGVGDQHLRLERTLHGTTRLHVTTPRGVEAWTIQPA